MTPWKIALTDLRYAPPYAGAMDNLVHLATALENRVTADLVVVSERARLRCLTVSSGATG